MRELKLGKLPPSAIDLEETVIGVIISIKSAIDEVVDLIKDPEIFYKAEHVLIYKTMKRMYQELIPIDLMSLVNELRKVGDLEQVGGILKLTGLMDRVVSNVSLEYNCRIILQKYIARQLIITSQTTIEECYLGQKDIFDLLTENSTKKDDLQNLISSKQDVSNGDLFEESFSELKIKREVEFTGVPSGFTKIDRVTGGFQPGNLIILAARPAMGKTSLALCFGINAAIQFKKPVGIFSLEMTRRQLMNKEMSIVAEVPLEKINKKWCNQEDLNRLGQFAPIFQEAPIHWDDTPAITIFEFRAKARRMKRMYGIEMIIIDYLQLMHGDRGKGVNREQEIGSISRGLKAIALELEIPIIALSQLSRAVESRPGNSKRPMLSDLRESGSIEQDADMVMFLYRPEYYGITETETGKPTTGMAEVLVAKNRHGETDDIVVEFVGKFTKFKDWDDEYKMQNDVVNTNNISNFTDNNLVIHASLQRDFTDNVDFDDVPF
ncbi:replicative DNA helicase [Sphingobacterium detergens]|uniref:replicative DNA helicase n=1 Tax=Sphingobacterium detergens TaxID=1145106 RepID=UPI003AACD549